jgi:hypothetical protein
LSKAHATETSPSSQVQSQLECLHPWLRTPYVAGMFHARCPASNWNGGASRHTDWHSWVVLRLLKNKQMKIFPLSFSLIMQVYNKCVVCTRWGLCIPAWQVQSQTNN